MWLTCVAGAQAQPFITVDSANQSITPKFYPADQTPPAAPVVQTTTFEPRHAPIVPASYQQPKPGMLQPRAPKGVEEHVEPYVRTELPGPQRLFMRLSESQFFERIQEERKREIGNRAIFPEGPVLTKEPYRPRNFPRIVELVEPCYVAHRRILFEQPNFERAGYDFGVLQPALCVGIYAYDLALLPYHVCSDLRGTGESNVGKCLPGDPSPLLFPIERFSVTGLVGQAGAAAGFGFLFP